MDADEARTHFLLSGERETTLASRVGVKRRSYRSSSRRRRKGGLAVNGIEISDEEEEESLERKLARLRREVAEVKGEFDRQSNKNSHASDPTAQVESESVDTLGQILESIVPASTRSQSRAASRLTKQLSSASQLEASTSDTTPDQSKQQDGQTSAYTVMYTPSYQEGHTLSKVADFDSRLTLIETALGLDAISLPTQEESESKAVIPTLSSLDKQLATLSTSTDSSLDTISRRIRQLSLDAEKLEQARRSAKAAQDALRPSSSSGPRSVVLNGVSKDAGILEDVEQVSKINALYGTLPIIESLAPLLPSVLDRLRSLRSLHADAATASQTLERVEARQDDMKQELQGWREGLDKVEEGMGKSELTIKGNTKMVEGWVKELEGRITELAR